MSRFSPAAALLAAFGLFLVPLPAADAFGPTPDRVQQTAEARLIAELSRFSALSDGTVGIAVRDLQSGEVIGLNIDTLFPMASTYKVAVAGKILSMADAGTLSVDERLPRLGMLFSVETLIEMMLTRSDNEATDALVARAGGPHEVDSWLHSIGIRGQRVDSNTAQLLARAKAASASAGGALLDDAVVAILSSRERDSRDLPNIAFALDPRDTSTPRAMNDLLAAIHHGKALKPRSTAMLLGVMARCRTGKARLPGMLPPGTPVAHKTGTLNGLGNDAGIVTLPNGRSFAISIFVMKDRRGHASRDRIMAEAARAAYDYFLFVPERHTA